MGNDLVIGLQLSVIGFSVTFLALGLLIGLMWLLLRIFPVKSDASEKPTKIAEEGEDEQRLEEMAVALAVGISLLEREGALDQRDRTLVQLFEER